jgi:hypothetical protein
MKKPVKIFVMSVGPYHKNGTVKWLERIKAQDLAIVCLPKEFEENKESYTKRNIEVYIYDEKKYINDDFEFFGFKPRNCGGIGRQGIAEAVEKFGDKYVCFQLDDDTSSYSIRKNGKSSSIRNKESLCELIYAFEKFYQITGIDIAGVTGATPPSGKFMTSRKIFNNFLMHKGWKSNFWGFAALCSDDRRYTIYRNIIDLTPTVSTELAIIAFTQNQGDRDDGNAVIYNSDYSWKKSFALKMVAPWCSVQFIKEEENRVLFREFTKLSNLYPDISLEENGKIVGKLQ